MILPRAKYSSQRDFNRETIGVCSNCGYTWRPETEHHRGTVGSMFYWLIVISFFPISISIWFWKSEKINLEPKIKAIILASVWAILIVFSLLFGDDTSSQEASQTDIVDDSPKFNNKDIGIDVQSEDSEEELTVIYDGDTLINQFLNRYNDIHPDIAIGASDVSVYHHNGQDHSDQVKIATDTEITISSAGLDTIKVYMEPNTRDEFLDIFKRYAKVFNSSLDDDTLDSIWNETEEESTHRKEFDDFDLDIRINTNGEIEYATLSGKFE